MSDLCTVSITGKDFKCDYKIERLHLNYCTGIFKQQIMDMSNFSFAFSSPKYDKRTFDLFFSEANKLSPFQNIQSDDQTSLFQLVNLCDDLQTPQLLKSSISNQLKSNGIFSLLPFLQQHDENSHQIENSIINSFSKGEIDHLFHVNLSIERILRIIEKMMKKKLLSNEELFAIIQKNHLNPLIICIQKEKIQEFLSNEGKKELFKSEMDYLNTSFLNNSSDKQKISELQQIIDSQAKIISDIQKQLESKVLTKDEFISTQQQMKSQLNDSISSLSSQFNSLVSSQITNISDSVSTQIEEVKENHKHEIENLRSTITSQNQQISDSVSTQIKEVKENHDHDFENLRSTITSQNQEVNKISDIISSKFNNLLALGSLIQIKTLLYDNNNPFHGIFNYIQSNGHKINISGPSCGYGGTHEVPTVAGHFKGRTTYNGTHPVPNHQSSEYFPYLTDISKTASPFAWWSPNGKNNTITFGFSSFVKGLVKLEITGYSLRVHENCEKMLAIPKNWTIEVPAPNGPITLDTRTNNSDLLNGEHQCYFPISQPKPLIIHSFTIRNTGVNHSNNDILMLSTVEIYGNIYIY